MSASKDPNQTTFIYNNFYQLYRQSKLAQLPKDELSKGVVLKTRAHTELPASATVRVISNEQQHSLHEWTHASLRANYRQLRESRKKLKFLLEEVQEVLAQD